MNEQQERVRRLMQEREEIAARVAKFRATQQRFEREREEHVEKTWQRLGKRGPVTSW